MRFCYLHILALTVVSLAGCGSAEKDKAEKDAADPPAADPHASGGHHDVLFWQRSNIQHNGFTIKLGHHGVHPHGGEPLEPAVSIIKDNFDIADAKVSVSLLAADGEVLAEDVACVFEPKSALEEAHYAQAKLDVPKGTEAVTIRYRIVLPGEADEFEQEVVVQVENH